MSSHRIGEEQEKKMLYYLRQRYPTTYFNWLSSESKSVYDIECSYALIDVVKVDSILRLITDHKNKCSEHIRLSESLGLPGYIGFFFLDVPYFISVKCHCFKKWKRVPLSMYLLSRNCERLPIPIEIGKHEPRECLEDKNKYAEDKLEAYHRAYMANELSWGDAYAVRPKKAKHQAYSRILRSGSKY